MSLRERGTPRTFWSSASLRLNMQWRIRRCLNPLCWIDGPDPLPAAGWLVPCTPVYGGRAVPEARHGWNSQSRE